MKKKTIKNNLWNIVILYISILKTLIFLHNYVNCNWRYSNNSYKLENWIYKKWKVIFVYSIVSKEIK